VVEIDRKKMVESEALLAFKEVLIEYTATRLGWIENKYRGSWFVVRDPGVPGP
jgi:hypothetical protein